MTLDKNGGAAYCVSGHKVFCCKIADDTASSCYWNDGKVCKNSDSQMTWSGSEESPSAVFCCPPDEVTRWKNCNWKGSRRCDLNHCDILTEVELTTRYSGGGDNCGYFKRQRAFCCQPTTGRPLFLPVPLENLFPNPPTGDGVASDFTLELDDTWGKGAGRLQVCSDAKRHC